MEIYQNILCAHQAPIEPSLIQGTLRKGKKGSILTVLETSKISCTLSVHLLYFCFSIVILYFSVSFFSHENDRI